MVRILSTVLLPTSGTATVNGIDVVTVWIPGESGIANEAPPREVDCVAGDSPFSGEAYAVLAGAADGNLIPARFLIDPEGVLRSVWREDDGDEWADPKRLLEEVRTICTEPLTIDSGGEHEHHH